MIDNYAYVLEFVPDCYKTQEMCKKAVNIFYAFLPALHEWFVTSKMIKTFHNALFTDNDILFYDQDSGNVTFSSDEMDFLV